MLSVVAPFNVNPLCFISFAVIVGFAGAVLSFFTVAVEYGDKFPALSFIITAISDIPIFCYT